MTGGAAAEDDPTSECLLCLSSAREVVLLPCRHLVACKECAVNMVEFGAGGQLVHGDDNAGTGDNNANPTGETGDGSGTAGTNDGEPSQPSTNVAPTPVIRPTTRRKRKAKGWFCPVCRQPYTSLLRISTVAPKGLGSGGKGLVLGHGGEGKKEVMGQVVETKAVEAAVAENEGGAEDEGGAEAAPATSVPEAATEEPSTVEISGS